MRLLSSRATFFQKRVRPAVYFGGLLIFATALSLTLGGSVALLPLRIVPVVTIVVCYFMYKRLDVDLVDEVLDDDNALVIRNGHEEARIPLSEIIDVSYSRFVNPREVTLSLRAPSVFGNRIRFYMPVPSAPFATIPVIDELIERIDAKRRAR
jgi:hypothetical protein